MGQQSALVLGASGLVGSEILQLCLRSDVYDQVIVPVRSPLGIDHHKLSEKVIKFDMPPWEDLFPVDHVYCCLGTTIKKAGSQANFRKVDYDYPMAFAIAAKKWHSAVFSVVTASGSNTKSNFFYNRVKGELEENLKKLTLNSTLVFQPSLLVGDRNEFRLGEKIGKGVAMLTSWMTPLSLRAVKGKSVAKAMVVETCSASSGFNIISNKAIHNIA
ncbi:MAG: oxidoreductase [Candidatus Neomarinimicrobiota bacterium]|nr:oxidoreductase [Candidatus Neomarinimicrobiota bacterium]